MISDTCWNLKGADFRCSLLGIARMASEVHIFGYHDPGKWTILISIHVSKSKIFHMNAWSAWGFHSLKCQSGHAHHGQKACYFPLSGETCCKKCEMHYPQSVIISVHRRQEKMCPTNPPLPPGRDILLWRHERQWRAFLIPNVCVDGWDSPFRVPVVPYVAHVKVGCSDTYEHAQTVLLLWHIHRSSSLWPRRVRGVGI